MNWLKILCSRLLEGRFSRSVSLLAGSTMVGQGFLVVVSPLLTRLYDPAAFGIFALYAALAGILGVLMGLRYELAIPLAETTEDAFQVLWLSLMVNLGMSFLVGIMVWGLADWIIVWANMPGIGPLLWLMPLGVLGIGLYQSLSYWVTRNQQFAVISQTRMSRAIGQGGIQLVLGWLNTGSAGLVWGFVLSQFVGLLPLLRGVQFRKPELPRMLYLASQYKVFPLINVWSALITNAGTFVPLFLFSHYFSLEVVGWFVLTNRVLSAPANLVGQAIAQVFYPEVADRQRQGLDVAPFVQRTATALLLLGFPVFALVGLNGGWSFSFLFGEEWHTAGLYAQILAPFFLVSFISSPLSSFALVRGKQLESLLFSIFNILAVVLAVAVGVWQNNATVAVAVFSAVEVAIYLAYLAWTFSLSKSSFGKWIHGLATFWLGCLVILGGIGILTHYHHWLGLGLGGVVFGLFSLWAWRRYMGAT